MKKLYILIVLITSITSAALAQVPSESWGLSFGSSQADSVKTSCTDPSGNYYVAGNFSGTADFDPSGGIASRSSVSASIDGFIVKFNSSGVFQWATTIGGSGTDVINSIVADANGVYVTGYFSGTANFDPSGSASRTSAGDLDLFVAKYGLSGGNLLFVNAFGDTGRDYGTAITVNSGALYVTGSFQGVVNFDPAGFGDDQITWGGADVFLAKYNTIGSYEWAIEIGSGTSDAGTAIASDGSSVWIAGYFSDTFFPDAFDFSVSGDPVGLKDGFISEYDVANGVWLAWGTIQSTGNDRFTALALDGNGGLYVAGQFSTTATMYGASSTSKSVISKGATDTFVGRYDIATRQLKWLNGFGTTIDDTIGGIAADANSVYVAGPTAGPEDLDPSGNIVNTTNSGAYDAFFVKYNSVAGAYVTSFTLGEGFFDAGSSVALGQGYIYYSGIFQSSMDLDPGGVDNTKFAFGSWDVFITRFAPVDPTTSPTSVAVTNVGATSATISFTGNGNPDGFITIFNVGSTATGLPSDNVVYSRNDFLGGGLSGQALASGPATSYTITGLNPSTNYFLSIFAYNGSSSAGSVINYKTTSPGLASFSTPALATEPTLGPSGIVVSSQTSSSFTITFTAPTPAPAGYIALRTVAPAVPNTDPSDGITYNTGTSLGNAVVASVGSSVMFNDSGLDFATTYNYKIYAYNGGAGTINYRQTNPLTGPGATIGSAEPTLQPTSLEFSSIGSTSFNYDFVASAGQNVAGYLGIRRTGAAPTFVPTDGVTLNVGDQNTDGSYVAFLGTDTGYGLTNATSNTSYYYAIYAYNGSGASINYLQTSPLTGTVTTLDPSLDTTKPTIHDNTPGTIGPNEGLTISADVTDAGSGVEYVYVEFYPINAADYGNEYLDFQSGDTYTYSIASSFNTEQGIEYKIHAVDYDGNEQETQWQSVVRRYTGDGLTIPYSAGGDQTSYRIISVPLDLQKKQVNDVFDELGNYDKTKYRLFHYQTSNVSELSGTSSIELGKGYWFIATQQATINSGPGTTAQTGIDKDITIQISNGWNQVGNPYNFDVDWSNVVAHNSDKTLGQFKTYEAKFNNATTLKKMSGGFVMVNVSGDNKLLIPVDKDARTAAPAPPVNFAQTIDSDIWGVDLLVRSGDMENTFAGFGMHTDANDQADKYDDYTLPRFMDYLELNYNKKLFGSSFTKDIVPTSSQHVWEFQVASNLPGELVELSWDNSYFGSSDLQLMLWDVNQQRAVDMRSERKYSFERSQSGTFKIFYGSESFVKQETLPNIAVFHSVSPVPSSGNVTFAFSVPESNGEVRTSLNIYNSLGQKVSKLVDEALAAGYHQTVWNIEDGTKPATGVYISVLKFGETTLQKRLIIK